MKAVLRITLITASIWMIFESASGNACAQVPGGPGGLPSGGPAYSPYLNLLNRGQSAGANYYGLVRPELEFRRAYRGLQQQFDMQQNDQQQADQRGLPTTGHAATFMSYRQYFLTNSPPIGQRSGLGQGQQVGRQMPQGGGAPGLAAPGSR